MDHDHCFRWAGSGKEGRQHCHWLFTDYILSGPGCPYPVFFVHGIGKDHIDDIDIGVTADLIEILMVVDIFPGNVILFHPDLLLGRDSVGDPGQIGGPGLLQAGSSKSVQ